MPTRLIATIAALTLMLASALRLLSCAKPTGTHVSYTCVNTERDVRVKSIVALIDSCPSWSYPDESGQDTANRILECCATISKESSDVILEAEKRFVAEHVSVQKYDTREMTKLYVLNRYLFSIPETAPSSRHLYAGFVGVPHSPAGVDILFPLSYSADGEIKLSGQFRGYYGLPYDFVNEFSFFRSTYGRRHRNSSEVIAKPLVGMYLRNSQI